MQFSRFARQFHPGSGILQLMHDLGEAMSDGDGICMLGGGNPARIEQIEHLLRDEMAAMLEDGDSFERMVGCYDDPAGNRRFREYLSHHLNDQFDWDLEPANIALTNGSQSSFGVIFNALAGAFDDGSERQVLLPVTPEYIGYSDVGIGDRNLFVARQPDIELHGDRRFKYRVDFDALELDSSIGAICVSRPTNPSGNVITNGELARLRGLAADHDIPLIVDGAYGQPFPGIIFSDVTPVWDRNTILCLSLSKFGLPGVRTGIVIADAPLVEMITGASAINTLSPGSFGPHLVRRLMQSGDIMEKSRQVIRPYYQQRCETAASLIDTLMADLPVRIHEPEGAIFLWLWFPGLPISTTELYRRLKQRGVFVIAGEHFFPGLPDDPDQPWSHRRECIRVSYAANEADVHAGLEVIADEARKAYNDH